MANSIDNIKYTLLNGIVVGDTIDLLQFIIQQSEPTNMMTTNTDQNVTNCIKTFVGDSELTGIMVKDTATGPDRVSIYSGTVYVSNSYDTIENRRAFSLNPNGLTRIVGTDGYTLSLPTKAGTVALVSDVLALSGGTMTGPIRFEQSPWLVGKEDNTGYLNLSGSADVSHGRITLYGSKNASYPGVFEINCQDESSSTAVSCIFKLKPDGTATWGGTEVARLGLTSTHGCTITASDYATDASFNTSSYRIDLGGGYHQYHLQYEVTLGTFTSLTSLKIGSITGLVGKIIGANTASRITTTGYIGSTGPMATFWGISNNTGNTINLYAKADTTSVVTTGKIGYVTMDFLTKES